MDITVKRLDHWGIVAGVIRDLGLIEAVDQEIGTDSREILTSGEVVAGLIINGLGFASKPLMLAPQFFENKALELLFGKDRDPEHFNRYKIGRVLDALSEFGCEKLFSLLASVICAQEGIETKFGHADTTSYTLYGNYDEGVDENGQPIEHRISITYGYSKANRFDLKQVVQELVTSNDGGVPFITKTLSGNASDSLILRERATALINDFAKSGQRCLVANCKLYAQGTANVLNKINFITRVPATVKLEKEYISKAVIASDEWIEISDKYKVQEFEVDLYTIKDQRWFVFYSKEALNRSKVALDKEIEKEKNALTAELRSLEKREFRCEADARNALSEQTKKLQYHNLSQAVVSTTKEYKGRGRPHAGSPYEDVYHISASIECNKNKCEKALNERSCFVIATNMHPDDLSAKEALENYKGQDKTEKGFAFLKSKEFFTSSLNLEKPGRIEAILMIMVLSLLVYSIAHRRLRRALEQANETIPNQVKKLTKKPTMRWVFQLFEGVNLVIITVDGARKRVIEGLTEIRQKIITLLGGNTLKMYQGP